MVKRIFAVIHKAPVGTRRERMGIRPQVDRKPLWAIVHNRMRF